MTYHILSKPNAYTHSHSPHMSWSSCTTINSINTIIHLFRSLNIPTFVGIPDTPIFFYQYNNILTCLIISCEYKSLQVFIRLCSTFQLIKYDGSMNIAFTNINGYYLIFKMKYHFNWCGCPKIC